jgi:hypothetical protein
MTPDPGAALVEILDTGSNLTVVSTDEDLPADFVKVTLDDGRVGYVHLREVESGIEAGELGERREPVGCISSTALLAIAALLVLSVALAFLTASRSGDANASLLAVIGCAFVVPFLLVVVGFYFYVRKREDELLDEREDVSGETAD